MDSLYWVEYIEKGFKCSDSWTMKTLLDEIEKKEVEITGVYYIYDDKEVGWFNVLEAILETVSRW